MQSKSLTPDSSVSARSAFVPSFSRIRPALLHFLISITIFSVLLLVVTSVWYPTPFFTASGGWEGIRLVAFVDVVLGPILTLAISNPSKSRKELMGDMSLIIAAQLLALAYGIFTIYNQRPVAVVFWENSFFTVEARELKQQNYNFAQLSTFDSDFPPFIYADRPATLEGQQQMMASIKTRDLPPYALPELYRPLDKTVIEDLKRFEVDIEEIVSLNLDMKKQLDRVLWEHRLAMSDAQYFLLNSRYHNIVMVFNASQKKIGYLSAPHKDK